MDYVEGINSTRVGSTIVLTLCNLGRRNAFYPEMRRKLTATIRTMGVDPDVRAIVVTGADGHFCVGADLSHVAARPSPPTVLETRENMKEVLELFRLLAVGPKPTIAAVEGDAFGAGCSIAAACDVVVATSKSRFGTAFAKIGLAPDLGMMYSLVERVGRTRARRMMSLASAISGQEAHQIGLADELVEPGYALERALEIANEYQSSAPISVALIKSALGAGIASVDDMARMELDLVPLAATSQDAREGIAAFSEKRKPLFTGR